MFKDLKIKKTILKDLEYHNIKNATSGTEYKNFVSSSFSKKTWWENTSFNPKNHEKLKNNINVFREKDLDKITIPSDSLRIGTAVHKMLLEPKSFFDDVIIKEIIPDGNTTHYYNKKMKEMEPVLKEIIFNGNTFLTTEEFELVKRLSDSVKNHQLYKKTIGDSLKNKLTEFQIIMKSDKFTLKGKLDIVNLIKNEQEEVVEILIGDIKTCATTNDYSNHYSFGSTKNIYQALYYEWLTMVYIHNNNNFFGKHKVAKDYEINSYYIAVGKNNTNDVLFMIPEYEKNYDEVTQNVMEMVSYKGEDKYTFKEKFYNLELTSTKPKLTEAEETELETTSGF